MGGWPAAGCTGVPALRPRDHAGQELVICLNLQLHVVVALLVLTMIDCAYGVKSLSSADAVGAALLQAGASQQFWRRPMYHWHQRQQRLAVAAALSC